MRKWDGFMKLGKEGQNVDDDEVDQPLEDRTHRSDAWESKHRPQQQKREWRPRARASCCFGKLVVVVMISLIVGGIAALPHLWSRVPELEFIHKSCGVVGYRPHVLSTTMSHLLATNCAHLMIPMLPVRERLKEAVEGAFGREYDLFVEFTGLISWTKGASIGWHSDDNRPYLQQRHYAAVCYLNEHEQDFKGGIFRFQEGEPAEIIPRRGTVLIYTADELNMHSVDEVTSGERCTLAVWFTSDEEHNEDLKLIKLLSTTPPQLEGRVDVERVSTDLGHDEPWAEEEEGSCKLTLKQDFPRAKAASSLMYSLKDFHADSSVFLKKDILDFNPVLRLEGNVEDLRDLRMISEGFDCHPTLTAFDNQDDCPVELAFKGVKVSPLLSSSLEALQVVEFHRWRRAVGESSPCRFGEQSIEFERGVSRGLCQAYSQEGISAQGCSVTDMKNRTEINPRDSSHGTLRESSSEGGRRRHPLYAEGETSVRMASDEVDDFLSSVEQFDIYSANLWSKLSQLIPLWRSHGILEYHE